MTSHRPRSPQRAAAGCTHTALRFERTAPPTAVTQGREVRVWRCGMCGLRFHDGTSAGLLVPLASNPLPVPVTANATYASGNDPDDPRPVRPTGTRTAYCLDHDRVVPEVEWGDHEVCDMREQHPNAIRGAGVLGQPTATAKVTRYVAGLDGLDRCLGGGLVRGTRVLFTGDPGAGKSSVMLLTLWRYAMRGIRVLYLTAEETREEIEIRFRRMGLAWTPNLILHSTELWEDATAAINRFRPQVIVVDSLQEFRCASGQGEAGDDRQVQQILKLTKAIVEGPRAPAMFIIGHIAKDGTAYGKMANVHKVTVWMHFSKGADGRRILRTLKNRHGAEGEIAMFEHPPDGSAIREVADVSELLLRDALGREGVVAYPVMPSERLARALVIPVEASVSPPKGPNDKRLRAAQGVPEGMLEDALDRLSDCDVRFTDRSVRLQAATMADEVVADSGVTLAVCLALTSASEHLEARVGAFGALSASGRVQADVQIEQRLAALVRAKVLTVYGPPLGTFRAPEGLEYTAVSSLAELVESVKARALFAKMRALELSPSGSVGN